MLKMALLCGGLFALLFLLPQVGFQNDFTPIVLVTLMVIVHYFMMRDHSHGGKSHANN